MILTRKKNLKLYFININRRTYNALKENRITNCLVELSNLKKKYYYYFVTVDIKYMDLYFFGDILCLPERFIFLLNIFLIFIYKYLCCW